MKLQVKQFKQRNQKTWIQQMMQADLHLPNNLKKKQFLNHILESNRQAHRNHILESNRQTHRKNRKQTCRAKHPQQSQDQDQTSRGTGLAMMGQGPQYAYMKAQFTPFVMALRQCNLTMLGVQ